VLHISYAWSNGYTELCERWVQFLAACISHQVDFLQGDGDLFSQRNFKKDDHLLAFSCRIEAADTPLAAGIQLQNNNIYILYSFWLICTNESSKTNIAMENGSFSSMIYLLNMLIFHVTSRNTRPVPERIPISMEWRFSPCPGPLFRAMLDVLRTVHYDRETGWNRRSKKAGRAP
jgi:hypothetical protein